MKSNIILAIAIGMLAQTVSAETLTYDCAVESREDRGWIAPRYLFVVDDAQMQATAESRNHDATPAKVKTDRKQRLRLTWRIVGTGNGGRKLNMIYNAALDPAKNTVQVRARFTNYNAVNRPVGHGTCKLVGA